MTFSRQLASLNIFSIADGKGELGQFNPAQIADFLRKSAVQETLVDHFQDEGGLRKMIKFMENAGPLPPAVQHYLISTRGSSDWRTPPLFAKPDSEAALMRGLLLTYSQSFEEGFEVLRQRFHSKLPPPTTYDAPIVSAASPTDRNHFFHRLVSGLGTVLGFCQVAYDKHKMGHNQDSIGFDPVTGTGTVKDGVGKSKDAHIASHHGVVSFLDTVREYEVGLKSALQLTHQQLLEGPCTTSAAFKIRADGALEFVGSGDVMIFVVRKLANGKRQVIPCFIPHNTPGFCLNLENKPYDHSFIRNHPDNEKVHSWLGGKAEDWQGRVPDINYGYFKLPGEDQFYYLQPGDGVLACCDGVWNLFNLEGMGKLFEGDQSPGERFWNFYRDVFYRLSLCFMAEDEPTLIEDGSLKGLWIKKNGLKNEALVYKTEDCRPEDLVERLSGDNMTALYVEYDPQI